MPTPLITQAQLDDICSKLEGLKNIQKARERLAGEKTDLVILQHRGQQMAFPLADLLASLDKQIDNAKRFVKSLGVDPDA